MPNVEELSRILVWILGSGLAGFGLPTSEALLQLVQPEILGALMLVLAAIWRLFRPPVTAAVE